MICCNYIFYCIIVIAIIIIYQLYLIKMAWVHSSGCLCKPKCDSVSSTPPHILHFLWSSPLHICPSFSALLFTPTENLIPVVRKTCETNIWVVLQISCHLFSISSDYLHLPPCLGLSQEGNAPSSLNVPTKTGGLHSTTTCLIQVFASRRFSFWQYIWNLFFF